MSTTETEQLKKDLQEERKLSRNLAEENARLNELVDKCRNAIREEFDLRADADQRIKELTSGLKKFIDTHGNKGDGILISKYPWLEEFKQLLTETDNS